VLWELLPDQTQALAWNAIGAVVILGMLAYVGVKQNLLITWAVIEWWAYEEMLVATCSMWRLFEPWVVPIGQEQCSARMGFRLGNISLVAVGILALYLLDDLQKTTTRERSK